MAKKVITKAKSDSYIVAAKKTANIFFSSQLTNGEPVEEIEYNFNVELPLEDFFDVEITIGDEIFRAHRAYLAQCSLYFQELIKKKASSFISLDLSSEKWISAAVLRLILQWIYTDRIPLCMSNYNAVSKSAKKLKMNGLLAICDEFLLQLCQQRGPMLVYDQAINKGIEKIQAYAKRYAAQNFLTVTRQHHFLNCTSIARVIRLLSDDNLAIPNEKCVFDAATAWLKAHWRTRHNHTEKIMSCVRFPLMSLEELYECCKHGDRFIVEHPATIQPFLKALLYRLSQIGGYEEQYENLIPKCTIRHFSLASDLLAERPSFDPVAKKHSMSSLPTNAEDVPLDVACASDPRRIKSALT